MCVCAGNETKEARVEENEKEREKETESTCIEHFGTVEALKLCDLMQNYF